MGLIHRGFLKEAGRQKFCDQMSSNSECSRNWQKLITKPLTTHAASWIACCMCVSCWVSSPSSGIDNYCLQLDIQLHRHLVFGKKLKWEGKKFMLWNQPIWPYSRWLQKVQPAIWKFSFLFVNFKHSLVFLTQFYFNISSFYLKMSHLKKGGIKIW